MGRTAYAKTAASTIILNIGVITKKDKKRSNMITKTADVKVPFRLSITIITVSYTHLDVYKRQGLGPVGVGLRGFESLPLHPIHPYFIGRGGVGGYPTGLWIPRLGFESRPRPHNYLLFLINFFP